MARRNMDKITAEAKIPDKYDLNTSELFTLMDKACKGKEGLFNALVQAFVYGFVLGERATKAKARTGGKV